MTISLRKTRAVCKLKTKMILRNRTVIFGPLMAIAFVLLYKAMWADMSAEHGMQGFILNLGVLFNTLMTGLMASALPLAEEKEKNTLRVLMTSSINSVEFFVGSLLPVFVLTEVVNIAILPISQVVGVPIGLFLLVTCLGVLITTLLGASIGLAGKDQTSTSLMLTPLMLLLMLPSMLGGLTGIAWMDGLARITYTGAMAANVSALAAGEPPAIGYSVLVYAAWIVLAAAAFILLYRRNRIDRG